MFKVFACKLSIQFNGRDISARSVGAIIIESDPEVELIATGDRHALDASEEQPEHIRYLHSLYVKFIDVTKHFYKKLTSRN